MNLKEFKEQVDQFANVLIDKANSNIFVSVHINTWLRVIATILAVDFIMNDD